MKIWQNKFITSTFILILSGMATKVLGLLIKIIFTRIVGNLTIGLYTLVMPTYSLLLTICSFAMPTSIAKIIASKKDMRVLNTATIIIICINVLMIALMHIFSPYIATNLLKEPDSYYLLIAMSYTLPFASLACILKGYFYGIQKMGPHAVSNTVEQIIRLALVIIVMPHLIKISYVHAAVGLILTSFVTELSSIITFLFFMKKEDVICLAKINFTTSYAKDIMQLSVPSVGSRIIGNIAYFFEPIIITNLLLYKGFSSEYILLEYGAYNAYAISTLTIPSFFITAISFALIPEISKYLEQRKHKLVKKRLHEAFLFTFLIGLFFSFVIFIFRKDLLLFLYGTTSGENYIKYLAPIFILFYFEAIFTSFLQAINKSSVTFKITIVTSIIKILAMIVLGLLGFGIYALLISEIINIILVVGLNYLYTRYYIKTYIT